MKKENILAAMMFGGQAGGGGLPPYDQGTSQSTLLVNDTGDLIWIRLSGKTDVDALSSFIEGAISAAISSGNEVCLSNETVDGDAYVYAKGELSDIGQAMGNGGSGVLGIGSGVGLACDFSDQRNCIYGFSIRSTQSGYYITGGVVLDLSTQNTIKAIVSVRAISPSPIS